MFNGRRQPSRGGTSRMTRECQVRFCERLGVKFPGPTRQSRHSDRAPITSGCLKGCLEATSQKARLVSGLKVHHTGIRLLCGGVKFVHTGKLNALVDNLRS
jgi:hypothetical protein